MKDPDMFVITGKHLFAATVAMLAILAIGELTEKPADARGDVGKALERQFR
jgi:hypothetical protein